MHPQTSKNSFNTHRPPTDQFQLGRHPSSPRTFNLLHASLRPSPLSDTLIGRIVKTAARIQSHKAHPAYWTLVNLRELLSVAVRLPCHTENGQARRTISTIKTAEARPSIVSSLNPSIHVCNVIALVGYRVCWSVHGKLCIIVKCE